MSVVIDTNVVLDLLVFDDPGCAPLRTALAAGGLRWLATDAMRGELARVLGYPLIAARLEKNAQRDERQRPQSQSQAEGAPGRRDAASVLAAFDAQVQRVAPAARAPCVCRDPDDQIFVDLAVAHRAQLVSKDRAVRALRKRLALLGVEFFDEKWLQCPVGGREQLLNS